MSILGNRVLRREDPKLLTSGGTYVGDLALAGMAHAGYLTSSAAHARIASLDATAARELPGVLAVLTASEIDLAPMAAGRTFNQAMGRPWLATGTVRFVGEPVALVVAESPALVEDALELIEVEYDPLPAVVDPAEAIGDLTLLFPEAGTNVAFRMDVPLSEEFFSGCDVVVTGELRNQRLAPGSLEVRSALASWDGDELLFQVSSQVPHTHRDVVAKSLGIDAARVRVVVPDVGGGFGAKASVYPEEVLIAYASRVVGRPVKWVESRSASMTGLGHGRGQLQRFTIGADRDGKVLAYRLEVVQDSGAYPMVGSFLPFLTKMMATGVYAIPACEFSSLSVVTNTTPVVSYRGAGRPEATAAIERAMDTLADEMGMDPGELRRRNFIPAGEFPYVTATGSSYDSGDYRRDLEQLLEAADYEGLLAAQHARRAEGSVRQLGIGISTYVEVTNGVMSPEFARVEVLSGGVARVFTGVAPQGQGHDTSWSMLVSDALGMEMSRIEVVHGDTARVARGVGTYGSRSLQVGGSAIHLAGLEVAKLAAAVAADHLEADPADIVFDAAVDGAHVAGAPEPFVTWAQIAGLAASKRVELAAETDFNPEGPTYPFGAHLAVVEVDTETGEVRLLRLVAVDDAGTILNPMLAEGQIHGGLAQGIAQALYEEVRYDELGNPLTSNFADYHLVSADTMPSFEVHHTSTPTPRNPLGAKGIGESGTIGSVPAVWNAVVDALSHRGVRSLPIPATPETVWKAIQGGA
ncbi:MAG: xanthine dehydrogenase family protein molybdopterin-binding subunit [Nitrospiraceae bacterium]|nr:xanthine dehydrogenase family protein molybdopterin-binding subunit [Nitrospiraceae bacterium]